MATEDTQANNDPPALKTSDVEKLYLTYPSFTEFLPWVDYVEESKVFVLEDGISCGALLELFPVGTEAMDQGKLIELRDAVQVALCNALPEYETHPWVLQLYVQDDLNLSKLQEQLSKYGEAEVRRSEYAQAFESTFDAHLERVTSPEGIFEDTAVSGRPWQGQVRRVRVALFRRLPETKTIPDPVQVEEAINSVVDQFQAALEQGGIRSERIDLQGFTRWLTPWFTPAPSICNGNPRDLADDICVSQVDEPTIGLNFAERLFVSQPRSELETGTWWFDNLPHTIVSVQGMSRAPSIGLFTAAREHGDRVFAFFDQLPPHSILALTIEVRSQALVSDRIARIKRASVGDSAEAQLAKEDSIACSHQQAQGNKIFAMSVGIYLRANDLQELNQHRTHVGALLLANGLHPIAQESDQLVLDSYIRNLPMVYDSELDQRTRRTRLAFTKHIANLLPVYGRGRGTGNPGFVFFNRSGEPLVFDPLNEKDRKKNGHMLILGPTGAGKSAMLVYLLQQVVARHRPRLFVIEAGGSFSLLGEHFRHHGLTVNQVTLHANADVSLPPFGAAANLVDQPNSQHAFQDGRDTLGEMEIVARVMVTGGDMKESERMTRADLMLIRNAILNAAKSQSRSGRQVLTEHVVEALRELSRDVKLPESRRIRAFDMADSMSLFCSGVAGHFFNRPGIEWPEVDVTIVEMGLLAREGYGDQLTVAYLSLMSHINHLVESKQHEQRPTLVVTDEGHIITTHPLLATYVIKITKMWRKYGAWFWIATQNLADFPNESRRMLNMIEWWLCLVLPKEEVENVARFRELSDMQRRLLLSAQKEPGKYVEGVVLSDKLEVLFRNVPPALSLALAMSEKHEKVERQRIMQERDCSEYEAALEVARRIVGTNT